MRIACPDCEGDGELCMSCDGWGEIDVYQANDSAMRLPGNWSAERERARATNKRRRARRREEVKAFGKPPPGWRELLPEAARRRRWLEKKDAEMAEARKVTARKHEEAAEIRRQELEDELVHRRGRKRAPTPEGFGRLLTTQAEVREELARRQLLRASGIPFEEWPATFAEAVIYCQEYHAGTEPGGEN